MNIRPKNNKILYADTGVKFSLNNLRGANWRQQVFNNYRLHLLDLLAKYGEADDYGKWLNEMLARHSNIYNLAGGEKGNWENIAYKNDLVGQYQQDYRGGLGNDGLYKRYGSILLNNSDRYDFNLTGIKTNQGTRYNIANPPSRTSGDYSRDGYNYKVDNLYSAITDDRRLLGRKGDWDEASEEYKQWQKDLNAKGWETYLDSDNYYKLRRLPNPDPKTNPLNGQNTPQGTGGGVPVGQRDDPESIWSKLGTGLKNVAPDLLDALRLAGNMHNNERVYNEMKKAIIPNLLQSYYTHRQVVGDEATKQAYYRRAAYGETKAAQPFTSDADRQIAYMNEAKRIGDELRAQGDLADNQEIRRTSDESNQHQWANIARNTEVANSNLTELIKARAAKHQLAALKHSADWTNIDLFLLGKQAKLELSKARQRAILDLIKTLQMLEDIANDPNIKVAYTALENKAKELFPDGNVNWQDPRLSDLVKNLLSVRRKAMIKYYTLYAKSGTKLTYSDNTDKYLYRTSRDIVEHFRKMSKMTDDSRIKTLPKPIKLTSHPKKRKYLLGGVAPFTIYRPLGVGGESAVSTQTSDSGSNKSSKDTAAKDKLDMIKELFKQVQGLPVDVSRVYQEISNTLNKAKAFGEELTTDDIASMYLNSMQKLAYLKYSSDAYEKAKALVTTNGGINELAVGANGEMIFQNKEGEFKIGTILNLNDKEWNPLTNDLVLELRAKSPNLAFNDKIFNIVNNGVGMTKIAEEIKSLAAGLGSYDKKIEGISEVLSNKVKAGLLTIAGYSETPDGFYKITKEIKDSSSNVNAALNYIYSVLPKNYKTLLEINSNGNGKQLILSYLNSQTSDYYKEDIAPLTGKASDKNSNRSDGKGGAESSAGLAFVMGLGPRELIDFNTGTSNAIRVLGIKGILLTHSKENLGQGATLLDATKSLQGGYLQWNKATFGGSRLNSQAYSHIILNDSTIMGMDLPYTKDINGNEVPDFLMTKKMELADLEISQNNILNPEDINKIYLKYGLPAKFDSNGNLNTMQYKRFAAIQVTLDEDSLLNKDAILSDEVALAGEIERDLYSQAMKKSDKNYDLSDGMWITGWGKDQIYKGTIFVPYSEDIAFAALSSGEPFKLNLPDNAATVQLMLYAPKASQYVAPDKTLSQIKNN